MNALLRELRNQTLQGMMAPAHRFFTPTEAFFSALEPYRDVMLVDAGTGLGQLPEEARERGFNMQGIDLLVRPNQSKTILFVDAESFPYSPERWLLMCRPDHSGWVYDTLEAALNRGASAFYVGLEQNFLVDLDDYLGRYAKAWPNVGKDGESMFLFTPACLDEGYSRPWE